MRKLLSFFTFMLGVALFVGCSPDTPTPPKDPNDHVKPEIELVEVEVTAETFTFEIQANKPCEYGYYYMSDLEGGSAPAMPEWFNANSGNVEDTTYITISELNPNTSYKLYVAARSLDDGEYSTVKTLAFTTLDDGKFKAIEVTEIGTDYFVFNINFEGNYLFLAFEKAYLSIFGTAENYLTQKSIREYGPKSIRWENGGTYGNEYMSVKPNMPYIIAAVNCNTDGSFYDNEGNLLYEVYTYEVTTKALDESNAKVEITLGNITSTSVDIKAVPDELVSTYYLYVIDTATFTDRLEIYGEGAFMAVMKSSYAWSAVSSIERTWGGLTPSTNYTLLKLIVDRAGAEAFSWQEFTTTEAVGAPAELSAELMAASKEPHKTLDLKIQTNGVSAKYAFNTTADVDLVRDSNYTDSQIAQSRGADLTEEQMAQANGAGVNITLENLWPETEYTAIIRVLNEEKTETVKTVTFTTPAKAVPTRVESELFTSLIGEWKVTYNYMDYYYENKRIDGVVVKIAAGVDDYTSELYRSHNRLVILDWPYQESNDHTSFLPKHLMANHSYWSENPNLAYRDYGPKVFLEIANGDVVTMPTEKGTYFFNPSIINNFKLEFFGTDINLKQNAPCAFPVTVSEDGNTITIGQYVSGAEFDYGVYRPAIWNNNTELRNVATSDIVLKRVVK